MTPLAGVLIAQHETPGEGRWFAYAMFGLFLIGVVVAAAAFGFAKARASERWKGIGQWGLTAAVYGGAMITFGLILALSRPDLRRDIPNWEKIGATVVAVLLGPLLFLLRRYQRVAYGSIEVAGAIATILFLSFSDQPTVWQRLSAYVAAIYFMVRGLDNIDQGSLRAVEPSPGVPQKPPKRL